MAKKLKVREKQKIFTFFDCDKDLLMSPLPIAIKYLQEVQAAHPGVTVELYEEWDYDAMDLKIMTTRVETNEEFAARIAREDAEEEAMRARAVRDRQKQKERNEKLAAYEKLKKELGL